MCVFLLVWYKIYKSDLFGNIQKIKKEKPACMHKNNPFSKTVSNHSLLHTLEEKKNKAKLSKSSLSSALVRFTNGETWVCARGRSHNFYDFFFLQHVSVCVWCFSKQKFSVFFSYVWSIIILHFIASRTFLGGGLNLATFRIFLVTKILASRVCWYVCVCVWYVFGIGFLVFFVLFLLVSWFERPRNF